MIRKVFQHTWDTPNQCPIRRNYWHARIRSSRRRTGSFGRCLTWVPWRDRIRRPNRRWPKWFSSQGSFREAFEFERERPVRHLRQPRWPVDEVYDYQSRQTVWQRHHLLPARAGNLWALRMRKPNECTTVEILSRFLKSILTDFNNIFLRLPQRWHPQEWIDLNRVDWLTNWYNSKWF